MVNYIRLTADYGSNQAFCGDLGTKPGQNQAMAMRHIARQFEI